MQGKAHEPRDVTRRMVASLEIGACMTRRFHVQDSRRSDRASFGARRFVVRARASVGPPRDPSKAIEWCGKALARLAIAGLGYRGL
jgi:hypothetical protein